MRIKSEKMNLYLTFYFCFKKKNKRRDAKKSLNTIREKLKMREKITINFIILYYV